MSDTGRSVSSVLEVGDGVSSVEPRFAYGWDCTALVPVLPSSLDAPQDVQPGRDAVPAVAASLASSDAPLMPPIRGTARGSRGFGYGFWRDVARVEVANARMVRVRGCMMAL